MMIRFLNVMVKKSVMVMAESDEELEEKRQKIVHDVIDENLYNSKYSNNVVEVSATYQTEK